MIMSQVNKIKDVMAFVFIDDEFKGCAVIFKNENYILVVTAYHVISKAVSHIEDCFHRIKIINENGSIYSVSDCKFCAEKDIAILYLIGGINELNTIVLFSGTLKPETDLISKVKSKTMTMPAILYSQEQVEQHDDSCFIINVSKDILGDSSGNWGANAMEGISGAGVFIKTHQYLILTGIITSIPDEGMLAKVVCSNANGFLNLEPSLKAYNDSEYNYGRDVIIDSVNMMRNKILDSTIDEWECDLKNIEYANNINRKLGVLHNKYKLDAAKSKIIRGLMIGDYLYSERMKVTPEFEKGYSYAHSAFCDKDMTFYATSRAEANNRYHKISDDYFTTLAGALRPLGLSDDDIHILCNRDIAFWLANCDLDFMDENDD